MRARSEPVGPLPVLGFKCVPIGTRLTREACGARHLNAGKPWEPGARKVKVWSEVCAKCELGAAHGRGERPRVWADGTPVVDVDIVPVQAILRQKPLRRKERVAAGWR